MALPQIPMTDFPDWQDIVQLLGAAGGLSVVAHAVRGGFKKGSQAFLESFERPGERAELIQEIFLGGRVGDSGQRLLFHPSTDWRPAPGQRAAPRASEGYPHDLRALQGLACYLPEDPHWTEDLVFKEEVAPRDKLVCAGSPKANLVVRHVLPSFVLSEDGAQQQYATLLPPEGLSYFFGEDHVSPRVEVISMMRGGTKSLKTRKMIWTWKRPGDLDCWQPRGYREGEELRKDFLLVSRLPVSQIGGDVLVFAGAHGAGTDSTRLLLENLHIRELRKLADRVGGQAYFQFVLEVTQVRHSRSGTLPVSVRISEELPPVVLELGASQLRAKPFLPAKVWR